MNDALAFLGKVFRAKDLRNKIFFVLGCVLLYRLAAHITVPGVDASVLANLTGQSELLGIFSVLTGGSLENFSIVLMGLTPYINASIIMQLMTVVIPRLEEWKKEGEAGQRKINAWTRYLTVPFAFLQSYGMIILLNSSANGALITDTKDLTVMLPIMATITFGSVFLMWLGEMMTERGIGNGTSVLIFVSIIAALPPIIGQALGLAQFQSSSLITLAIFGLISLALLAFVVYFTEGARNIPITYAKRGTRAANGNLPIKVNQAGMIPIIFSVSMLTFPVILSQFGQNSSNEIVREVSRWFLSHLDAANPNLLYIALYFALVVAFTFFYVSITFQPNKVAENLQSRGGFVPGIRPGAETEKYLGEVSNRLNLWGGFAIAFVAVLPIILQTALASQGASSAHILISGAGLIIIVGVILDIRRQLHAQMVMHDYDKYK